MFSSIFNFPEITEEVVNQTLQKHNGVKFRKNEMKTDFQNLYMEVPTLNTKVILVYPIVLVVGTLIQQTHILQFAKEWYFIQSRNFINKIFAGNAYIFLLLVLLSVTVLKVLDYYNGPILPLNHKQRNQTLEKLVTMRALKICLTFFDLNIFLNHQIGIFNIITRHTQFCSIIEYTDSQTCILNKGEWHKGFDPSGHLFLLSTVSLITINELQKISPLEANKYHQNILNKLNEITVILGLVLLIIWLELFTVTSIFYHTVLEKIIGLSIGFVTATLINQL